VATVYVTGHRNPDLDSIGSAIGYAELKNALGDGDEYVPARLGEVNPQTAWALERAGAAEPSLLPHIKLRVCDVMGPCVVTAGCEDPVRGVGLAMAEQDLDVVPVVASDGTLAGVLTERVLARLYVRDSRGPSDFGERAVPLESIRELLDGEILVPADHQVSGRLYVVSMAAEDMGEIVGAGDIAVVGNLPELQRQAVALGADLLVLSNGVRPADDVLEAARARGTSVVVSPLDSYVTARMVSLAVPCERIMDPEPLTVGPEDVLEDVVDDMLDVEYRAAVVVDGGRRPLGIVGRSDLVSPTPRKVLLVDHAEQGQSVPGIERADIVEILDHHHVGSIETRQPVLATFDPVGSTATLVVERFRAAGRSPSREAGTMLLAAMLSDTVVLTSPTTTDRDRAVADWLGSCLDLDVEAFGLEMFQESSDVSGLSATDIVARDAKEYELASGGTVLVAQVEVVGDELLSRREELMGALEEARERGEHRIVALMVTDIVRKGTTLLVAGKERGLATAFGDGARPADGAIDLPGVMSRKKQVVPKLLAAL
jgi:manganese-dependent inorganic pyrophosphatase